MSDIETGEAYEAVRLHPELYIGKVEYSTAPLAILEQCIKRSRAMAKSIGIDLYAKGVAGLMSDRIRVIDDGPGWDVTPDKFGSRPAERALRELTAPDNGGLCFVNALSSSFEFTTWTEGRAWCQRFAFGKPVTDFLDNGPCGHTHGIQLFFSLDPQILTYTLPARNAVEALLAEIRADGVHVDLKVFADHA